MQRDESRRVKDLLSLSGGLGFRLGQGLGLGARHQLAKAGSVSGARARVGLRASKTLVLTLSPTGERREARGEPMVGHGADRVEHKVHLVRGGEVRQRHAREAGA